MFDCKAYTCSHLTPFLHHRKEKSLWSILKNKEKNSVCVSCKFPFGQTHHSYHCDHLPDALESDEELDAPEDDTAPVDATYDHPEHVVTVTTVCDIDLEGDSIIGHNKVGLHIRTFYITLSAHQNAQHNVGGHKNRSTKQGGGLNLGFCPGRGARHKVSPGMGPWNQRKKTFCIGYL